MENFEDGIHIKAFAHKHDIGCMSVSVCLHVFTTYCSQIF